MVNYVDEIFMSRGDELSGKRIVLCVTGSVSAYKAADIARILIRHGATVYAVMSEDAQNIIHPNLMQWATGNPVITKLTGGLEHVALTSGRNSADLILIAPCTANTISKIANGIDDTSVTSVASSALGAGIPVLIAPAMHDTMINQPIVSENIDRLRKVGVRMIPPIMEEGKAKIADAQTILEHVVYQFKKKELAGKKVLITAGPTVERIDPVRVITNMSSGKTGMALVREALRRGGSVTLIYGPGVENPPDGANVVYVESAEEMFRAAVDELKRERYDIFIGSAAVSDYAPESQVEDKIKSAEKSEIILRLRSTPKIIDEVKRLSLATYLVIFKAEYNISNEELIERGRKRMQQSGADMAIVNDVSKKGVGFRADENEVIIIDSEVKQLPRMSKSKIAEEIWNRIIENLKR